MGDLRHASPAFRARDELEIRGPLPLWYEMGLMKWEYSTCWGGFYHCLAVPGCPVGSESEGERQEGTEVGQREGWLMADGPGEGRPACVCFTVWHGCLT